MYIFVYGTLRYKGSSHHLIEGEEYKGICKTKEKYYMVCPTSKAFPYCSTGQIVPDTEPSEIVGEVYDVSLSTLRRLDSLEGHPTHYTRTTIVLENNILADMYLLETNSVVEGLRCSGRFMAVPQGDWMAFMDSNESPAFLQEHQECQEGPHLPHESVSK